ncbi:uncharacterized protein LOC124256339 isoform X2 [Haliotis rubra]|nr:uncharacterized protein LOC124256339 isoform X2 [Haliotis rubra]
MISEKAHEPVQHIFGSKWSSLSEGTLQKVSLFVARLSSEKIGYTACGLFTIDKSALLMLGGTVLTYVVVVLQVQPDSDAGCLTPGSFNLTHLCP